jgi:hypothetical protein
MLESATPDRSLKGFCLMFFGSHFGRASHPALSERSVNSDPLTRRIVDITTDEDETILISFVPVGAQFVIINKRNQTKGSLQERPSRKLDSINMKICEVI